MLMTSLLVGGHESVARVDVRVAADGTQFVALDTLAAAEDGVAAGAVLHERRVVGPLVGDALHRQDGHARAFEPLANQMA